ncbi:MAG: GTPase Era [Candidatus Planktophila sp.]
MSDFRSGFVAIVGRPNTGKSTLVNALVGSKIAITSHHPNTTRHAIRGIINNENFQAVLVDTPGVHKPRTLLGHHLNKVVNENLESVDVIMMCLPANEATGAGDQFIAAEIAKHPRAKKFALVTKTDTVNKKTLADRLMTISDLAEGFTWDEIIPVSAVIHDQIELLGKIIGENIPVGPAFYPEDQKSDQGTEQLICELIREAAMRDALQELPHSIMVTIDEMSEREPNGTRPFYDIHASIHVERDSQTGIILGHQGQRLKDIGMRARKDIERELGARIFLGLHVKVSKEWQRDPKLLERLGFSDKKH